MHLTEKGGSGRISCSGSCLGGLSRRRHQSVDPGIGASHRDGMAPHIRIRVRQCARCGGLHKSRSTECKIRGVDSRGEKATRTLTAVHSAGRSAQVGPAGGLPAPYTDSAGVYAGAAFNLNSFSSCASDQEGDK